MPGQSGETVAGCAVSILPQTTAVEFTHLEACMWRHACGGMRVEALEGGMTDVPMIAWVASARSPACSLHLPVRGARVLSASFVLCV